MKTLPRKFYQRNTIEVARELLGKILVRKIENTTLTGRIVETEAYLGRNDPATRKQYLKIIQGEVGKAFIYMVHGNWLFNIIAHPQNSEGAILIRALEPLSGIEKMKEYRKVNDIKNLTNGPGKLTQALLITNKLNFEDLTSNKSRIYICDTEELRPYTILSSHRIGVKKDLPIKLRFYIESPFISKR